MERSRIFQADQDRDHFLERLGSLPIESLTPRYVWALLPNHIHLLLWSGPVPLFAG